MENKVTIYLRSGQTVGQFRMPEREAIELSDMVLTRTDEVRKREFSCNSGKFICDVGEITGLAREPVSAYDSESSA